MPDVFFVRFFDTSTKKWEWEGCDTIEDAIEQMHRCNNPALGSEIRYRLGPPKPKITEARAKELIEEWLVCDDGEWEQTIIQRRIPGLLDLARRLGVLEQPS